jgi:hypothetical protein
MIGDANALRPRLMSVADRMLGSVADAQIRALVAGRDPFNHGGGA